MGETGSLLLQTGRLHYKKAAARHSQGDLSIWITGYEGAGKTLCIPGQIEGYDVTKVERKAFLSNRSLIRVSVPDTVDEIGHWAFAGCKELEEIDISGKELSFGSGVFRKCIKLERISFPHTLHGCARLLAASAVDLEADYLLSPAQAGSREWYGWLDGRILDIIRESEETALKELVYCAEEDMLAKQEACLDGQVKKKTRIALLRLLYKENLSRDMADRLITFLQRSVHQGRCPAVWETLKGGCEERFAWCDILLDAGIINEENLDSVRQSFGVEEVELKACLLQKWQERERRSSLWKQLEL